MNHAKNSKFLTTQWSGIIPNFAKTSAHFLLHQPLQCLSNVMELELRMISGRLASTDKPESYHMESVTLSPKARVCIQKLISVQVCNSTKCALQGVYTRVKMPRSVEV